MIHLLFLHQTGSNNPLGVRSNLEKIRFHPFFSFKDLFGFLFILWILVLLNLTNPYILGDVENFIPANPLVTPVHIQPEWYFLFAYAILRSIPNKLGGVIALVLSIAILYTLPLFKSNLNSLTFSPVSQVLFWSFVTTSILLTWIGARPVEDPFIIIGQVLTVVYFILFFIIYSRKLLWEKIIKILLIGWKP